MGNRKKTMRAFIFILFLGSLFFAFVHVSAQGYPVYTFTGRVYYNNAPAANASVSFTSHFCCFSPKWNQVCWYHPCQPSNAAVAAYQTVKTNQYGYYRISFEQAGDMRFYVVGAKINGIRSPWATVSSTQTQNTQDLYIYEGPEPPEPPCTPYCP
jgi:hypothetical protein